MLLTSSLAPKQHAAARDAVANGEAQLVVGTHALIQEHVEFASLAVAVVDEQHRFGVEQRRALSGSAERSPHILHMTATPIPRTLAQTVYGDLDVTEIARPPRDRKEIITAWVPQERSAAAYTRLRKHLERRAAGVRRVPARLRERDDRGARRRGGGRASEPGRAEGLPRRLPPRPARSARASRR